MNEPEHTPAEEPEHLPAPAQQNLATFDALTRAFGARNLITPLESSVRVESAQSAADACRALETMDFDFAPVVDNGVVTGIFNRFDAVDHPDLTVGDLRRPLDAKHIISGDAPLLETLRWLEKQPFLFIIDGREITGFVTRSDVDKQPGLLFFFLRIVELEQALAALVREHFPVQQNALDLLGEDAKRTVEDRLQRSRDADRALDLVVYMDLSHLIRIVRKCDSLHGALGFASGSAWDKATAGILKLRTNVMHPVRGLDDPDLPLERVIHVLDQIEALLDRLR